MDEQSRQVLMVEADVDRQHYLGRFLRDWGWEPVVSTSVDEAMAAIASTQYLFSLLDLDLTGTDGTEFLRRLRVHGGSPGPIVVLGTGPGTK
ncbi:MAG TPA: response regulator, partial [Gemmatimonadales bacterium]|nr:response regulator [Gemmatimonadales bacterium]